MCYTLKLKFSLNMSNFDQKKKKNIRFYITSLTP